MNCVDVRDRLAEHALGVLEEDDLRQVDRHLQWCAGCRKESAEMLEGLAKVPLSLRPVDPEPSLEDRVVEAVAAASGRGRGTARRGLRMLAVATLAAAITAASAFGWAFAERAKVQGLKEKVASVESSQRGLARLFKELKEHSRGNGTLYEATLYPGPAHQQAGQALVFSGAKGSGFVLVEVVVALDGRIGPYQVELQDRAGHIRQVGRLERTSNQTYLLYRPFDQSLENLSKPEAIELRRLDLLQVTDRTGTTVLTGLVKPYVTAPPAQ
jgi:predicted anti-sigma-YlaC factor YlaD